MRRLAADTLAGWQTADQAMAQPALRSHIRALLRDEVEPTFHGLAERSEFTSALARALGSLRHWGAADALRLGSPE